MKKLLTILSAVSLTATGASSVVACKIAAIQDEYDEETDVSKDSKTLNTINEKIKTEFKKSLFKENILLNDNNLSKVYDWVTVSDPSLNLKFNNIEHQNLKKWILTFFYPIFNNINQQIKNEYSNYYQNSDAIFVEESDIDITLNFINLQELNKLFNIDVSNLKAVSISFNFKYKVRFKKYESDSTLTSSFNFANNLEEFNLIKNNSLDFFKKELLAFFKDKNKINITMNGFESLYDNFDIDYKKSISSIDDIYKKMLKNFIMNNQKLKEIITYNDSKNFLETQITLFNDDYDKGFYYNKENDISQNSFLTKWYKNDEVKANDFVDLYMKKIVPKFNTNSNLELGQFKINLNYINFLGMSLNGYFNISDNDFISTIILPKNKLEEKLTNFANLIIAFLKYYKVEYVKDKYYFKVSDSVWNKLNDKITNYKLPKILFEEFKNDASIINQNLKDLNLFDFIQKSVWKIRKIKYNIEENMFLYSDGGADAGFTFGPSKFIYMPFYYLWSKYKYVVVKT